MTAPTEPAPDPLVEPGLPADWWDETPAQAAHYDRVYWNPRRGLMNDYPYLPADCRAGRCDHEPDRCTRYRSRRCLSGECTHARQNLMCGVNYPTESNAR